LGKSESFSQQLDRIKFPLWAVAIVLLFANVALEWLHLHEHMPDPFTWLLVRGAFGGAMLFSVVAFGYWVLNRPSPALTYASDAILPVYLMHQTTLILAADAIVGQRWPLMLEAAVLVAAAGLAPVALYHVLVRRTPWLRFLFGLRPKLRVAPPPQPESTPDYLEKGTSVRGSP
jgi:hypothetical protein